MARRTQAAVSWAPSSTRGCWAHALYEARAASLLFQGHSPAFRLHAISET